MKHKIKHGDVFKWVEHNNVYVFLRRNNKAEGLVPVSLGGSHGVKAGTVFHEQDRINIELNSDLTYLGNINKVFKVLENHYKDK